MPRRRSNDATAPGHHVLRQVAASLDAHPSLLRHLPELFAELSSLGSMPRLVVRLLREASIGPRARVLDLGCGKGAAAVHVARMFGCTVLGIDAFEPFIASAADLARRRSVADLCRFRLADLHALRPTARYDAALMLGVLPLERAAPLLRRWVRPGGVYIIDDAFRADDATDPELAGIPTRAQARAVFLRADDTLLREAVPSRRDIARQNARIYDAIARTSRRLARHDPRLAPTLRAYLVAQRHASDLLIGPLRGACWLVRRGAVP